CESVDTWETPIVHLIYGADLQVANCVYFGKPPTYSSALYGIRELIHFLQHIFRAFFKLSQQGMNYQSRANLERTMHSIHRNEMREQVEGRKLSFALSGEGKASHYCSASIKRVIVRFRSLSDRRNSSILLIE